jgi:hypothetical protein
MNAAMSCKPILSENLLACADTWQYIFEIDCQPQ